MAFDALMLYCVLNEIKSSALGARVDKIYQPERDEIIISLHTFSGSKKLLINFGSNSPRIGISALQKENPATPPMLCMLLRKHLSGARLSGVFQASFDRVAYLEFESKDDMGFSCKKYILVELMGKYSNLVLTDGQKKIIYAVKTVEFSHNGWQILPGMKYEEPPKQDKKNPLDCDRDEFFEDFKKYGGEKRCDKFITDTFSGISALVAREISYMASGNTDTFLSFCSCERLFEEFANVMERVKSGDLFPCALCKNENPNSPFEYSFLPINQYSGAAIVKKLDTCCELLDYFFENRDREQSVRQKASDILRLLTNAETRIKKKLELQKNELNDCAKAAEYKKYGDLITENLYCLKRGMKSAVLTDYSDFHEDGSFGSCEIELDERLSPAANAQRMYKKYNKAKNAIVELTKQIKNGEEELEYVYSVFDSLSRASSAVDLAEIRDELYRSGYASKMKNYSERKPTKNIISEFRTDGGFCVLCGRNNLQNEQITHKMASKNDYWFHVKNQPGSHTVLICNGKEPSERDFTQAAEIAAFFSKAADSPSTAVDYTLVRNLKKPSGAKPGFVIYHTNYTAYVSPDRQKIEKMRIK